MCIWMLQFIAIDNHLGYFFQFYRTKNGWMMNSFGVRDDLDNWITEKAKNKFLYFRGY